LVYDELGKDGVPYHPIRSRRGSDSALAPPTGAARVEAEQLGGNKLWHQRKAPSFRDGPAE
jgi:hypothetical protein